MALAFSPVSSGISFNKVNLLFLTISLYFCISLAANFTCPSGVIRASKDAACTDLPSSVRFLAAALAISAALSYCFKSPTNITILSYSNEIDFGKRIIREEIAKNVDAWIKSKDRGFYSIPYIFHRKYNINRTLHFCTLNRFFLGIVGTVGTNFHNSISDP